MKLYFYRITDEGAKLLMTTHNAMVIEFKYCSRLVRNAIKLRHKVIIKN